jgi:ankyrin repeat protein
MALVAGKIINISGAEDTNTPQSYSRTEFTVDKIVHAVQYGDFPFIETAIEQYQISPALTDSDGCSIFHWACINNRREIANFLIGRKINVNYIGGANQENALQWAVRNLKAIELVSILLLNEADFMHKSKYGLDALFIAVHAGNMHAVYLLLLNGSNPNTVSNDDNTPLLWLLKNPHVMHNSDMIRILLSFGADAGVADANGDNPLHHCTLAGRNANPRIMFALAEKGADINGKNKQDMSPYKVCYFK